jgi:hypothetical protein
MTLKRFYDWNVFFLYSAKLNKLLVLNTPQKKSFPSKQKSVILSNKSKMDLTSKSIGLVLKWRVRYLVYAGALKFFWKKTSAQPGLPEQVLIDGAMLRGKSQILASNPSIFPFMHLHVQKSGVYRFFESFRNTTLAFKDA